MTTRISGERAVWLETHVLPHEAALRQWLAQRVHAPIEVDDVLQEAYAAMASLADIRHVQSPRAYFFTVARSLVLQQLRRARIVSIEAVAEVEQLDMVGNLLTPERHATGRQDLRRIAEMIADLPEKCRQAYLLRKVYGYSQREVAEKMGISENTVEKHIGKGLRLLLAAHAGDLGPAAESAGPSEVRGIRDGQKNGY
ncbi:MAG: RNA polymerase sigma factor [Lysobacter sp.]